MDEAKSDWYQCVGEQPEKPKPNENDNQNGNGLESSPSLRLVSSLYPAGEPVGVDRASLWRNAFNYLSSLESSPQYNQKALDQDNIVCPHNVQWQEKYIIEGSHIPPAPDLSGSIESIVDAGCDYLERRFEAVNLGWSKCFGKTDNDTCSAEKEGLYSTPSRDRKMMKKVEILLVLGAYAEVNYYGKTCKVNIFKNLDKPPLFKEIYLFDMDGGYASWLYKFYENIRFAQVDNRGNQTIEPNQTGSISDPRVDYPLRWGCPADDKNLECLDVRTWP